MSLQYDHILVQMLMILFPIILYQALVNNRKLEKKEPFYWGMVFTITMGLCVAFAIKIDDGIYIDMRMVPWYLAFIYGGKTVGIFVTLFYAVIRFLVGGAGMIPAFIVLFFSTIVIWRFSVNFLKWNRRQKILYSIVFLVISSAMLPIIGVTLLQKTLTMSRLYIHIGFVIANGLSVWLAVHLLESYREKKELEREVQKSEKLLVVGQVAASVAHEIRNPMTSVRGFLQLLSGSKNVNEAEKKYIKICIDEIDRANEIISDYLSLGRNKESEQHVLVDLSSIAIKSVNTLCSYASINNVQLSIITGTGTLITGNSSRLQQMLVNLIKNAIEAAHPNGKVEVRVESIGHQVILTVKDNGIGMTTEQMENIGIPYYSTKEKGTGLGLMITLQIIKEMNGTWNVASQQSKGTQFNISFRKQEGVSVASLV